MTADGIATCTASWVHGVHVRMKFIILTGLSQPPSGTRVQLERCVDTELARSGTVMQTYV